MRSTARALVSAVALVLALAGCTGGAPTSSSSASAGGGDDGQIRYLVEQPEDAATLKLLQTHLADFEKQNPGTKVTLEAMPSDNMRTVLQTQLRSGEGPDVF